MTVADTTSSAPAIGAIRAAQITMGRGHVDVSSIKHEGRLGILFRPRESFVPVGADGELQPGTYWPVEGDVVIWIENAAGAEVILEYLTPFLDTTPSAPAQSVDALREAHVQIVANFLHERDMAFVETDEMTPEERRASAEMILDLIALAAPPRDDAASTEGDAPITAIDRIIIDDAFDAASTPALTVAPPAEGWLSEAIVRRVYEHFQRGAQYPCSANAMREAIEMALAAAPHPGAPS